jgi:hypothetical protein
MSSSGPITADGSTATKIGSPSSITSVASSTWST